MNEANKTPAPEYPFLFYFGRLRDWISRELDITPTQAAFALLDLEETHGKKSILAMFGFIRYAENKKLSYAKRRATINHDLMGRKDQHCEPRTTDYLQFINL